MLVELVHLVGRLCALVTPAADHGRHPVIDVLEAIDWLAHGILQIAHGQKVRNCGPRRAWSGDARHALHGAGRATGLQRPGSVDGKA
eukprot:2933306-Pyramimonas_sp.AAC.1